MRRWHKLRANLKVETVHSAVWFDTETMEVRDGPNKVRHVLRFGWLCARRRVRKGAWSRDSWSRFETADQFWDQLSALVRTRTRTFAFCHNTNFDLPVIDVFGASARHGWTLTSAVIEGPPTIVTFKRGTATLTFLDMLNWWREPLARLGEKVGLPKLDMPGKGSSQEEWDVYCRRDVEIIMRMMIEWWDFLVKHDLGGFAPTAASQAFRTWRHRFMPSGVVIDGDEEALKLARESYHGGRCECFRLGRVEGPLYELDVNSMYGSVMVGGGFPARLIGVRHEWMIDEVASMCERYCVVSDVTLDTDTPCYPVVKSGKLIFPVGRFRAVLTTPELEYAMHHGHVAACRAVAFYTAADLFTSYVHFFYTMRRLGEGDREGIDAKMGRLMLNSLYGKFGQHGRVYVSQGPAPDMSCCVETIVDADSGKVYQYRQMAGLQQIFQDECESRDSHPAISSHITAYGRLTLWLLMLKAGLDNVIYSDTDSLIVTEAGYVHLHSELDAARLGALKLVAVHPHGIFRGAKDYTLGERTKIKGIRKDAVEIGQGVYRQARWSGLRGLVRSGHVDAPVTETITKRLRRLYDKGLVLPGGVVAPLVLDEP